MVEELSPMSFLFYVSPKEHSSITETLNIQQTTYNFFHISPVNSSSSLHLHPIQGKVNLPNEWGHSLHNSVGHAENYTWLLPHYPGMGGRGGVGRRKVLFKYFHKTGTGTHRHNIPMQLLNWAVTTAPIQKFVRTHRHTPPSPQPHQYCASKTPASPADWPISLLQGGVGWTGAMPAPVYEPPSQPRPHPDLF